MARRDVDLVIRAKDEAAKVLDQITAALEDFSNASRGVDGSAEKTESSLGQLGAAIATLEKSLGGLQVADKLDRELRDAATALSRMEDKFSEGQREAREYEKRLAQVGSQADRFAAKQDGATAALERQKSAVKTAKASQKELAQAYSEAERSQARLVARQEKLPQQIAKQSAALDKAQARYAELAEKIENVEKPSRTLREQFEASARSVDQNVAKLNKLTTEYSEIGGKIRVAGSAMTIFGEQSQQAAQNVARQETVLKKIDDNLTAVKASATAFASEQGRIQKQVDGATQSLERQQQAINKAEGNYVELAQSAGRADAALEELSAQSLGKLTSELTAQRKAALLAKREYVNLSTEATRLAGEIGAATRPSRELIEAFDRTKIKAKEAKDAYLEQQVALHRMGQAYRETGTDLTSINSTQARFQTILAATTAALTQNAAAADKAQKELSDMNADSARNAAAQERVAAAARRAAAANAQGATSTSRLAAAYREFYGDTRRSLSLLQRIRGEVLSLIAAYGGLYGAIEVLRGTVDAYQQLEAAQSRLNVAVGGDQEAAAKELDFLRRTADRLGISFGTLATEYSKFAIATQGTNLAGENTRKIFTAVAEAARVNRSSTKEMAGVFTALTQIVSKGAVQMEELRQQLGDRLPGAIKIMADGLNVGTDELIKMMEQGEVTADALVPFAEELERKFGSGLPDALNSVSVAIGRLANEAFEALLRFGEAGFLESFQNFVNQIVATLKSAEFQDFAARASRAVAGLIDILSLGVENFDLLFAAASAFLGLKLTPLFIAIAGSLNVTTVAATKTGASFAALQARAAAMGVNITRAGYAVRSLRLALVSLLSTTGIGLLVAAVGAGIALWATSATDTTEAMVEHEKVLDQVKNAYDAVGGSVEEWRKQLETLTATEAEANLRRIQGALEETRDSLDLLAKGNDEFLTNFFGYNLRAGQEIFNVSDEYKKAVQSIIASYRDGTLAAEKLIPALDEANQKYSDGTEETNQFGEALIKMARKELEVSKAHEQATDTLTARTGAVDEAQESFDRLANRVEEAVDPTKDFSDAFEKLSGISSDLVKDIPKSTSKVQEAADEAGKLADAYEDALKAARALPDAIQRAAAEQKVFTTYAEGMKAALAQAEGAIASQYDQFTSGTEAAAAYIREKEGFRSSPYYDVNAYRVGFGSDTVTLADGTIKKVTQGMTVSIEDANRDLMRRIATEFAPAVANAVGEDRFNALTAQQQAALVSLAYNYGAGEFQSGGDLAAVAAAVRAGSKEGVVAAITARAGDNNGINRGRRLEEAALFNTNSGVQYAVQEQEKLAEKQAEFREGLKDDIETLRQEAEVQSQNLIAQEQQKAIREAELAAKKVGLELTEQERQAILANVAAKFAQKQAEEDVASAKEKAAAAEAKVTALLAQRRALDKALDFAQAEGDTEKATELAAKLVEVNNQIEAAIANAKAMWEAIGGDAATNAIIKLDTAALSADNLEQKAQKNYLQWDRVGDLFVTGLASAFDTFAQKVAEGESKGEAARQAFLQFAADFLRQIAQMILQQAIFNALQIAFGGTGFGNLIGVGHTGGMVGGSRVGSGNSTRRVSPAMFAGAARYHQGGIIGLKPGEVPIIAQQGEEMLTRDDPRHMLNGGGMASGGDGKKGMTIINTFDPVEAYERALATPRGEELLVNAVRSKRTEIKAALG